MDEFNLDTLKPTDEDILLMEGEEEEMEKKEGNTAKEEAFNMNYDGDSMRIYLQEISRIPQLSREEEVELAKVINSGGEAAVEAREKLINSNLRLVVYHAKKYVSDEFDLADLNAMGTEGLMKAVDKFDYTLGYKFSTYASWWIKQAILRGIIGERGMVRIPVHMYDTIQKVKKAQCIYRQSNYAEEPTLEKLSEISGLEEKKIVAALQYMYSYVSIDASIKEDEDETLQNFIVDDKAEDPYKAAEKKCLDEAIQAVLSKLSEKEAMVLTLRNGIGTGKPMTLDEISRLPGFGVTRERVRQIESKAINKIKRISALRNLLRDFVA